MLALTPRHRCTANDRRARERKGAEAGLPTAADHQPGCDSTGSDFGADTGRSRQRGSYSWLSRRFVVITSAANPLSRARSGTAGMGAGLDLRNAPPVAGQLFASFFSVPDIAPSGPAV